MIDSKLILIEGVPCSGKSTIAEKLAKDISYNGIKCECYLEWSKDSPVFIGNVEDLSEIISTIGSRKKRILKDWINFTKNTKQLETVDIIESHFWQTEAMYLYLSGHFEYEIFKRNKKVVSVISKLNPILIYLAPENIRQTFKQASKDKNKKWIESGRKGTWESWGNVVYEQQKWFTRRLLKGTEATIKFFTEWSLIADKLYDKFPFRKIRIPNPQDNWELAMDKIRDFLNIKKQTI